MIITRTPDGEALVAPALVPEPEPEGARANTRTVATGWQAGWPWFIIALVARGYLVFLLALAACALVPIVTGLTGSVVLTGSMAPLIQVGDVVLAQPLAHSAPVPLGRVVTFTAETNTGSDDLVLHRVVAINEFHQLITKGDANLNPDSAPLARNDVVGLARILVPWVGLPALWAHGGSFVPFVLWLVLTIAALVIESLATRSEVSPRSPRVRRRVARLLHAAAEPGGVVVTLLTVIALAAVSSISQVDASFNAQTSSVGNKWSTAAANPAVRLVFSKNPSNSTGGVAFSTQPAVVYQDAQGKTTVSGGSVTLSITTPGGAVLACASNPVASAAGTSTFSGCSINKAGTYTLTARSGGLIAAVSASFVISRGPAVGLQFSVSPTATTANTTLKTTPVVNVVDAGGNTVSSTTSITLSLTSAQGATLVCGVNPRAAVAGQIAFPGCRINLPGTYSLTARATGLTAAVSAAFVIGGPALALLSCRDQVYMATFSWSPTPYTATQYTLYVNGIQVPATGADGWNSYVQLTSNNLPANAQFPQGAATLEVRKVVNGVESVIGDGTVYLGSASKRTYTCS
jgi:signal peptidase I